MWRCRWRGPPRVGTHLPAPPAGPFSLPPSPRSPVAVRFSQAACEHNKASSHRSIRDGGVNEVSERETRWMKSCSTLPGSQSTHSLWGHAHTHIYIHSACVGQTINLLHLVAHLELIIGFLSFLRIDSGDTKGFQRHSVRRSHWIWLCNISLCLWVRSPLMCAAWILEWMNEWIFTTNWHSSYGKETTMVLLQS